MFPSARYALRFEGIGMRLSEYKKRLVKLKKAIKEKNIMFDALKKQLLQLELEQPLLGKKPPS